MVFRVVFTCILLILTNCYGTARASMVREKGTIVPPDFNLNPARSIRWNADGLAVTAYSRGFMQGDAVYLEIFTSDRECAPDTITCTVNGIPVKMVCRDWGYRGIFAISPTEMPGDREIVFNRENGSLKRSFVMRFTVYKSNFRCMNRPLYLGKFSNVNYPADPEILKFIEDCSKKKKSVFAEINDDALGDSISHPRDMHYITSPFWIQRVYSMYRWKNGRRVRLAPKKKYHEGIDLRGETGESVYAMADGVVVLAEPMFYEGNMVVLDHGNGIFTCYMHLGSFIVHKGDRVSAGSGIATVGNTGISTASHLHVSLIINGIHADPMSMLYLPLKK
jgi:murein DD-endopeptidase